MSARFFLSLCLITLLASGTWAQPSGALLIKAGAILDVRTGKMLTNQQILVEGGIIKAIGPALKLPDGALELDWSSYTILPGLMDCHTHISGQSDGNYYDRFRKTLADMAILAPVYAKRTLEAGFTTIRDMGSTGFLDVALRNAINEGKLQGPRILAATYYIGSTGSHGDMVGFSPWLTFKFPEEMTGVSDGVDGVRKKVRYLVKNGADVIKFGASAGVLSEEESVGAPQYTQEEMNAIVSEAHMWGKRVGAHAHGTEAIKMAVRAGVNSIEHGSLIDDEGIAMMIKSGTYLVADVYNDDYILAEFSRLGFPQKIIDKERLVGQTQRQNFQKAVKAGVKVAFGTDAGVYPHGDNGKQFAHMVKWGMTPLQAIQAATINAADLLGLSDKAGAVEVGKYADLIAVFGNPLTKIDLLEANPNFVMKGGALVHP
ncbi:MAG: amidohydrolase family protein [Cyclobacteriaceae bacterium]